MRYRYSQFLVFAITLSLLLHISCQESTKWKDSSDLKYDQEADSEESRSDQARPKIEFDKLTHDFGEVASHKKYIGEFRITNTGDSLLKITEVKPCCGTVTKLDKYVLAPGETGLLSVEYNSASGPSIMNRKIYVHSNDRTNPRVELGLTAKIIAKVAHEPKRINLVLNKENADCPKITINSLDEQSFSIKSFQSAGNSITADVDPSVEARKFVLQPKVDFEILKSHPNGFIQINLTHPDCERINIYFSTLLRFQMTPKSIILFDPEPHKSVVKELSMTSNYGEDFEIESTSYEKGMAKVVNQQPIANGYRLEVEIMPPSRDETQMFTDVVHVRLKGGEELAIKCYVRYTSK